MSDTGTGATVIATGIDQLRERTPVEGGKVASGSLFSGTDARVVQLVLDEGTELKEHRAPSPILVQVLEGEVRFDVGGDNHRLGAGGMVHVAGSVPHAVTALGTARIMIILLEPGPHKHG